MKTGKPLEAKRNVFDPVTGKATRISGCHECLLRHDWDDYENSFGKSSWCRATHRDVTFSRSFPDHCPLKEAK